MIRKLCLAAAFLCALALPASPSHAQGGDPPPRYDTIEQALSAATPAAGEAKAAPVVVQLQAVPAALDTSVAVPVNVWLANAREFLTTLLLGVLTFLSAFLPKPVAWALRAYGLQKLASMAVNFGINAVPGAVRNAPLSVDVGSRVLAVAMRWAVEEIPGFLLRLAGGEEGLRARIFALLHLEADASADTFGVAAPGAADAAPVS